jgi:hypothetical protein
VDAVVLAGLPTGACGSSGVGLSALDGRSCANIVVHRGVATRTINATGHKSIATNPKKPYLRITVRSLLMFRYAIVNSLSLFSNKSCYQVDFPAK